jgi:hypothetical protein
MSQMTAVKRCCPATYCQLLSSPDKRQSEGERLFDHRIGQDRAAIKRGGEMIKMSRRDTLKQMTLAGAALAGAGLFRPHTAATAWQPTNTSVPRG